MKTESTEVEPPPRRLPALVTAYYQKLGVSIQWAGREFFSDTGLPLPRGWTLHPNKHVAFNRRRKLVTVGTPGLGDLLATPIEYLPHEATHCVWPSRLMADPGVEWGCGMMHFELAWLTRLVRESGADQRLLLECLDYAREGKPLFSNRMELCLKRAKAAVHKHGLPDPWATE